MKIEKLFESELSEVKDKHFDVIAHELWGNQREGYEVNTSWFIKRRATLAELLEAVRHRWEVFKVNYSPRATVGSISFDGDDKTVYAQSEGIPFLEIRVL